MHTMRSNIVILGVGSFSCFHSIKRTHGQIDAGEMLVMPVVVLSASLRLMISNDRYLATNTTHEVILTMCPLAHLQLSV